MIDTTLKEKGDYVSIKGPFSNKDLRVLEKYQRIDKLSLTEQELVTVKITSGLSGLQSLRELWLWCTVTRTAMRHIISIPDIEVIDILDLRYPGSLSDFSQAKTLKEFRCNHYMTKADIFEIAKAPILQELGAHSADICHSSLDALLHMSSLENLDLERSKFDDEMAAVVSKSKSLKHLHIGGTRLTAKGLKKISQMSQLKSLDIWDTDIIESDLDCLANLSNLEYLSIGNNYFEQKLLAKNIIPRLQQIPSLKRIWLDWIDLTEDENILLHECYEYVGH